MADKYLAGIDPGVSGAIAILHGGDLVEVWDVPTLQIKVGKATKTRVAPELLAAELKPWAGRLDTACIEAVSASPQMGSASSFAFGQAFGLVVGVLAAYQVPTVLVVPSRWKRDLGLTSDKDMSRQRAMQLWPKHAAEFKLKKHDGRAEAALLALWLHRQH